MHICICIYGLHQDLYIYIYTQTRTHTHTHTHTQVLMQATAAAPPALKGATNSTAADGTMVPSQRFYRALYTKLSSWELRGSSKHALLLNLVFKALKADPKPMRVLAFLKRLLQVAAMM